MKTDYAFNNFSKALLTLEEFLKAPVTNNRDRAGIIQAYEFTFESCWKLIKKAVESHNIMVGSSRQAFKAAFQLGWIDEADQKLWLQMIDDRNLTSHTYKEELAAEVLHRIQSQHFQLFKKLQKVLKPVA